MSSTDQVFKQIRRDFKLSLSSASDKFEDFESASSLNDTCSSM